MQNQQPPQQTGLINEKQTNMRSIFFTKTASMLWLESQGMQGRKWNLTENIMKKILLPDHMANTEEWSAEANNHLRRILLNKITIDPGTKNTFPFPIGIRITNLQGSEYSTDGERWMYVIPANTTIQYPQVVFESHGDENLQKTWEDEFAKFDINNLDTLMAMDVPDSDVMLVHTEHPVLQMLERKKADFGVVGSASSVSSTPNWRHVNKNVFQSGSQWIKTNILAKSSKIVDLTQLSVVFGRVDSTKFTDLSPNVFSGINVEELGGIDEANAWKQNFGNIIVQKPFNLEIKLGLRYRLTMSHG